MSRRSTSIVIAGLVVLVAALLSIAQSYLPPWPEEWEQFRWLIWPVVIALLAVSMGLAVWQAVIDLSAVTPTTTQALQNRKRMIEMVRFVWIKGVLEQPMYKTARIDLGLEEKSEAIKYRPLGVAIQQPNRESRQFPPSTRMIEIFDELGKGLLILGDPGTGKTTLLLELASDLLDRAERDTTYPIPVAFYLSSWAERRLPLEEWLVDELNKLGVKPKIGRAWVDNEQIIPLLDGLDEVSPEYRLACVEAINTFRQHHGLVPIAVCSRIVDYDALAVRLRLHGAVVVQPLTRHRVESFLEQAGEPLKGVRDALKSDHVLWELLETPLMLNIVGLAYHRRPATEVQANGTLEERRNHLFDAYTNAMFERPGRATSQSKAAKYSQEHTINWLVYLAKEMNIHHQTVFQVERMQPDWLPTMAQRRIMKIGVMLISGLVIGLLVGLIFFQVSGLAGGLASGLVSVLIGMMWADRESIQPFEKLQFSWQEFWREIKAWGMLPIIPPLGFILIIWLIKSILWTSQELTFIVLYFLLLGLVLMLLAGLSAALRNVEISEHKMPNESIGFSIQNGLIALLLIGTVSGLIGGLAFGLVFGLVIGLAAGIISGFCFGIGAALQHYILRLLLWCNGFAPLSYIQFLDYAADHVFLRRVGGG